MIVKTITKEEYRRRLSRFVSEEKAALTEYIPSGVFANWGFYVHCQESFDSRLAEDGIEVE